jgi:hypothetical protein
VTKNDGNDHDQYDDDGDDTLAELLMHFRRMDWSVRRNDSLNVHIIMMGEGLLLTDGFSRCMIVLANDVLLSRFSRLLLLH